MARIELTERHLASRLKARNGARDKDTKSPLSLRTRVVSSGKARVTFEFLYRSLGRMRTLKLGEYTGDGGMSLKQARIAARAAKAKLDGGVDPNDEKADGRRARQLEKANTFASIAETFLSELRLRGLRPRTLSEYERIIRKRLIPRLGNLPVSKIGRSDLRQLRDELLLEGVSIARSCLERAQAVLNFAAQEEIIPAVPSLAGLNVTVPSRTRRWSDVELRALWKAAQTLESPWTQYVRLLILSGTRRTELASLKWEHVQPDKITFPADDTKGGRWHTLPLPRLAQEILATIPRGSGPYVFSTDRGTTHIRGYSKLKMSLDRRLDHPIDDWRLHDCRHNLSSFLADRGYPEAERGALLNHAGKSITSIYTHSDTLTTKLRALTEWEHHILTLLDGNANQTVPFRHQLGSPR